MSSKNGLTIVNVYTFQKLLAVRNIQPNHTVTLLTIPLKDAIIRDLLVNETAQVNNNNLFIAKDDNFKIVSRPSNIEIVKVDSKVEARRELRVFIIA